MATFRVVLRFIGRSGKRIGVTVAGLLLLLAGAVMLVTPGPGLLAIIAGLAVLGTEYAWAQRALDQAREKARQAARRVRRRRGSPREPEPEGGSGSGS
ncbi:MAG: PGPGW domain-containing protein [Actinomycetota bacterium]